MWKLVATAMIGPVTEHVCSKVLNIDSLPGPTLSAEQLRATWPKELSPP